MDIHVIPYPNKVRFDSGVYAFQNRAALVVQQEKDDTLPEAGYRLEIKTNGIRLFYACEKGAFYGRQTLEQLLDTCQSNQLPCCVIEDSPAYGHRGFMIDCVRHFFKVDDLKKMIAACARLKMNVFHWHLTDDQGWRIQIDKYPQLVEKGSVRPYSDFGRYQEPGEYSGFYTKAEIREIVAFCASLFIEVIPEIEMPGHASSLLAAIPELSCFGEAVAVKTRGGVYQDTMCIGNPKTGETLRCILDEVIELFPGDKIHLGGDEAPKDHWKKCPKCQAVMAQNHLNNEGALQCWFTNEMAGYLKSKGKKAIVWNDALKGGRLDPDIIIQYWIGDSDLPVVHVNGGGQMIMSDFYHYYLDYSYGQTPLDKTYQFDPIPKGVQSGRQKDMLGVESPIWTEYVPDLNKMAFQCFPRILAVAESGWTLPTQKSIERFQQCAKAYVPVLVRAGLTPAPEPYWNMDRLGRIKSLVGFWYHSMTWTDLKEFVKRLHEERKEEEQMK